MKKKISTFLLISLLTFSGTTIALSSCNPETIGDYEISLDVEDGVSVLITGGNHKNAGDIVTFNVVVPEGRDVDTVTITPEVTLNKGENNYYSFVMPSSNVTIAVTTKDEVLDISHALNNLKNKKIEVNLEAHTTYGGEGYEGYTLVEEINIFFGETSYTVQSTIPEYNQVNEPVTVFKNSEGYAVYQEIGLNNELLETPILDGYDIEFDGNFSNPFNALTADNFVLNGNSYDLVSDNSILIRSLLTNSGSEEEPLEFKFIPNKDNSLSFTCLDAVVSFQDIYSYQTEYEGTITVTDRVDEVVTPYTREDYHDNLEAALNEVKNANNNFTFTRTIKDAEGVDLVPENVFKMNEGVLLIENDPRNENKSHGYAVYDDNNWYPFEIENNAPVRTGSSDGTSEEITYLPMFNIFNEEIFYSEEEGVYQIQQPDYFGMYVSAYIVPGDDYQTVMEFYDGKGVTFYVSDNHLTGFMFNLLIDGETYTYEVKISDIGTTSIPYEFLIESEETGDFAWLNDVIGTWSSATDDTILVINSSNDITLNGEQITNLTTKVNSLNQHVLDFYVGETNYTATFSQWQGEYDEVYLFNVTHGGQVSLSKDA